MTGKVSDPASQGVDPAVLDQALKYLESACGDQGISQVVVICHGYLIWAGADIDNVHNIWSCSKSFTSTVLGLLIDDGLCTLDDKAVKYLPSIDDQYSTYGKITLRHFATMTSGYDGGGDQSKTPFTPTKPLFKPGEKVSATGTRP